MTDSGLSKSTSSADSNDYWGWDPESSTVVLRKKNSEEILEDMLMDQVNALHVAPTPPSRYSAPKSQRHQSTPPSQLATPHSISRFPRARSVESPGFRCVPSPSQSHPFSDPDSSFDDSALDDSRISEGDSDYFPSANTSANTSLGTVDTPILSGLGIFGLTKSDGSPFDGTGVVGLSSADASSLDDEELGDLAEYTGPRQVSRTLIDEVSRTFSSLPPRHRALKRLIATRDPVCTVAAARTPTPYPHDFMEGAGGGYFPKQNVLLARK